MFFRLVCKREKRVNLVGSWSLKGKRNLLTVNSGVFGMTPPSRDLKTPRIEGGI